MKRALTIAGCFVTLVSLAAGTAFGAWLASSTGDATAKAVTLAQGNTPTVAASGQALTVSWAQNAVSGTNIGALTDGGYLVTRYAEGSTTAITPATNCSTIVSGTDASLSCVENGVPNGSWQYTVTPALAAWRGTEGAKGTAVTVAVVDNTRPTVTNVTSTTPNGAYSSGTSIPVLVTFSEPVVVTGTPTLTLSTGSPSSTAVSYASGSGTATLTFPYSVAAGNFSADLSYAATNSLATPGAIAIKDAAGNQAITTLPALGAAGSLSANKDIVIDGSVPTVTGVTSPIANGSYRAGTEIPVTVTFSEPVNVLGIPTLTLATGTPATTAVNYTSGGGTSTLTFLYTVAAGNTSADLNYAATSSLAVNGGSIKDVVNDAVLTLPGLQAPGSLSTNSDIVIDTTTPTISSLALTDGGGAPGTIEWKDSFSITFSEQMSLGSFCPGWSGASIDGNNAVTVTLTDGTTTNDSITISTTGCTFNFGAIDLGSNVYVTGGNATFSASGPVANRSSITWTASTRTLRITLGTKTGAGTLANVSSSDAVYTPSSSITDLAGNAVFGTGSTGTVKNF